MFEEQGISKLRINKGLKNNIQVLTNDKARFTTVFVVDNAI